MRQPAPCKIKREHGDRYLCAWDFNLKEAKKIHAWFGRLIKYLEGKSNEK